jgi:hypothetical protein
LLKEAMNMPPALLLVLVVALLHVVLMAAWED